MELKPFSESVILAKFSNYANLRLIGELSDTQADLFIKDTLPEILAANLHLIINCNYLTKLSPAWIRALTLTDQNVRKNGKELRLILVNTDIKNLFEDKGLSQVLVLRSNIREALLSLKLVGNKSLDVGFINPF